MTKKLVKSSVLKIIQEDKKKIFNVINFKFHVEQ